MASIQVAAQVYPVGETVVPSNPNQQTFPQRTVFQGKVVIPIATQIDPNTAADFFLELMLLDNSWTLLDSSTAFSVTRTGQPVTQVNFTENWDTPITVKGIRMRIVVRDKVAGSGLAQPVSLAAGTVTWN